MHPSSPRPQTCSRGKRAPPLCTRAPQPTHNATLQSPLTARAQTHPPPGLKRYFHGKRMQGLLSARGLRILDFGCDTLLDDPYRPMALWDIIER